MSGTPNITPASGRRVKVHKSVRIGGVLLPACRSRTAPENPVTWIETEAPITCSICRKEAPTWR